MEMNKIQFELNTCVTFAAVVQEIQYKDISLIRMFF